MTILDVQDYQKALDIAADCGCPLSEDEIKERAATVAMEISELKVGANLYRLLMSGEISAVLDEETGELRWYATKEK